jgi:ADP-ribose pyrophosphatase YjhB (NUDIX family)
MIESGRRIERRVLFYHPSTGEVLGSWTFANEGKHGANIQHEALLQQIRRELSEEHGVEVEILENHEVTQLSNLHHRVDVVSKRLVEHGPEGLGRGMSTHLRF